MYLRFETEKFGIDSRMKLNSYSTTLIIFECGTIRISVINWIASLNIFQLSWPNQMIQMTNAILLIPFNGL